ncbi:MAG: hypothetical protein DWQ10_17990 [Calditrichaeota bacterium]|nr:MAG: hypothetical protein DWQ10_17990 [Calditrichota bacterium]
MQIIETPIFTQKLKNLLSDDDYRNLQNTIIANPEAGNIIRGSNGLRKIRWTRQGSGKSGGVRVIYYWLKPKKIIIVLLLYPKNEQDNLTQEQLKILSNFVRQEFK